MSRLWEKFDDVLTHDYLTRVLPVVPRDSCALLNERKVSAHASHLADLAYDVLSEHFLEELLALDLVVLAVPFAGQHKACPPVLSPVMGFFLPHRGLALVIALACPDYL